MIKSSIYQVLVPMNIGFKHAQVDRNHAESIILKINYKNKYTGIGECAPRAYVSQEDYQTVIDYLIKIDLNMLILSIDFNNIYTAINTLNNLQLSNIGNSHATLNVWCIIELALLDLLGNYFNLSLQ